MAKYTTLVRSICEVNSGLVESTGFDSVNTVIANSRKKIFSFDYPIFDEAYRPTLETKILKHYYMREIGLETVGLWKLALDAKMNEIMPYYNELYKTQVLEYNPLYDVDYQKTHEGSDKKDRNGNEKITENNSTNITNTKTNDLSEKRTDNLNQTTTNNLNQKTTADSSSNETNGTHVTTSGTSTKNGTKWDYFHDTPQGSVTNLDTANYLTNARKITENDTVTDSGKSDTTGNRDIDNNSTETTTNTGTIKIDNGGSETTTNTGTIKDIGSTTESNTKDKNFNEDINGTNQYVEHVIGKIGGQSYASMIKEFRDNLLNIDLMIINELNDLFMLIWDSAL